MIVALLALPACNREPPRVQPPEGFAIPELGLTRDARIYEYKDTKTGRDLKGPTGKAVKAGEPGEWDIKFKSGRTWDVVYNLVDAELSPLGFVNADTLNTQPWPVQQFLLQKQGVQGSVAVWWVSSERNLLVEMYNLDYDESAQADSAKPPFHYEICVSEGQPSSD